MKLLDSPLDQALNPGLMRVLNDPKCSLGELLADERNTRIISEHAESFRKEMKHWRVNKAERPSGPSDASIAKLSPETKELLIEGFYRMIDGFYHANKPEVAAPRERMPKSLKAITRDAGALWLQQQLTQCADIQAYPGNKETAIICLLGSTIKRAANAGRAIGITPPRSLEKAVRIDYFGRNSLPETTSSPSR